MDHRKALAVKMASALRLLIIGYGNPLRSDDSLGLLVAERLSEIPKIVIDQSIEIKKVHQLLPELAETIARADEVIFIDSAMASEQAPPGSLISTIVEIDSKSAITMGHHFTPKALMAFTSAMFGVQPNARILSITAESFDYGVTLSPTVEQAMPSLIKLIQQRIGLLIN